MSSQLWMNFYLTEAYRTYVVASATSPRERAYTYSELSKLLAREH